MNHPSRRGPPQVSGAGSEDTSDDRATDAIREANGELTAKTAHLLELPLKLLVEQRDRALREVEKIRETSEREQRAGVAEQDAFIAFLMDDHEKKLEELRTKIAAARERVVRMEALSPVVPEAPPAEGGAPDSAASRDTEARIQSLQRQLEDSYAEVDETRAEACRLQEELDDAIRSADDQRLEVYRDVEKARDESFELQLKLDETKRELDDARDDAREAQFRSSEELDSARRELDDRRDEVRRLRDRLGEIDGHSRPAPPPVNVELDGARSEIQRLRRQLVEAKRELSFTTRELEKMHQRDARIRDAARSPSAAKRLDSRKDTLPGMTRR